MQPGDNFVELMKGFEGCVLCPYVDAVKIPTIGIGSTHYEDGTAVTLRDRCISYERAVSLLNGYVNSEVISINAIVRSTLNQNQFDAILSFSYNEGIGRFKSSTMFKKININPNDQTIRDEFNKYVWGHDAKTGLPVKISGLISRRKKEADLYFTPWP